METKCVRVGLLVAGALFFSLSCSDDDKKTTDPTPEPPAIEEISPTSGEVGSSVRIDGRHFGSTKGASVVAFAGRVALTTSWSDTRINATVPDSATSGPIVVTVDGMASNGVNFTVTEPIPEIVIDRLIPARTVVGDRVTISGTGFDIATQEDPVVVTFAGVAQTRIEADVLDVTTDSVNVTVPQGAVDGSVRVQIGAAQSNDVEFSVAPALISYAADLLPMFTVYGCVSCHSGVGASGHLQVDTMANLMLGNSDHGPVVIPRDSGGSIIVQKLSPEPPFGDRMPQGCTESCVSEPEQLKVRDWIDQGATTE